MEYTIKQRFSLKHSYTLTKSENNTISTIFHTFTTISTANSAFITISDNSDNNCNTDIITAISTTPGPKGQGLAAASSS